MGRWVFLESDDVARVRGAVALRTAFSVSTSSIPSSFARFGRQLRLFRNELGRIFGYGASATEGQHNAT